jgi:hypothetical protein
MDTCDIVLHLPDGTDLGGQEEGITPMWNK